jgi:hypothetical protein
MTSVRVLNCDTSNPNGNAGETAISFVGTPQNSLRAEAPPRRANKLFWAAATVAAASTFWLIGWATSPAPGTRAWHQETLDRTAKAFDHCKRHFPSQAFYDCVRDRAGRWIRMNYYASSNGVPAYEEQLAEFGRAEAQAKADKSGDLGREAIEACHSVFGPQNSLAFADCIVTHMYPASEAPKDQTRFLSSR